MWIRSPYLQYAAAAFCKQSTETNLCILWINCEINCDFGCGNRLFSRMSYKCICYAAQWSSWWQLLASVTNSTSRPGHSMWQMSEELDCEGQMSSSLPKLEFILKLEMNWLFAVVWRYCCDPDLHSWFKPFMTHPVIPKQDEIMIRLDQRGFSVC